MLVASGVCLWSGCGQWCLSVVRHWSVVSGCGQTVVSGVRLWPVVSGCGQWCLSVASGVRLWPVVSVCGRAVVSGVCLWSGCGQLVVSSVSFTGRSARRGCLAGEGKVCITLWTDRELVLLFVQ